MGRSGLGLFYGVFRVGWIVGFDRILLGFVRRGVSNNFGIFLVFWSIDRKLSRLILGRVSRVELLDTREQI